MWQCPFVFSFVCWLVFELFRPIKERTIAVSRRGVLRAWQTISFLFCQTKEPTQRCHKLIKNFVEKVHLINLQTVFRLHAQAVFLWKAKSESISRRKCFSSFLFFFFLRNLLPLSVQWALKQGNILVNFGTSFARAWTLTNCWLVFRLIFLVHKVFTYFYLLYSYNSIVYSMHA